jgi:hypothetical protein
MFKLILAAIAEKENRSHKTGHIQHMACSYLSGNDGAFVMVVLMSPGIKCADKHHENVRF